MSEINIIHLSDLHINNKQDSNCTMIQESLENDIINIVEKSGLKIDIIVISGDLIDKGDTDAFQSIANMISNLLEKLELSKERLLIVPGNHDIPRTKVDKLLIESVIHDSNILLKEDVPDEWDRMKPRFSKFSNFIKKITENEDEFLSYGVGVREFNIREMNVQFYLLNTSWLSTGDDYQNLGVGRWQLEHIRKKKEDLKKPDISITLSHHPFSWMTQEQNGMIEDYLFSNRKIGSDIILHGHMHNAKIRSMTYPDWSVVELTSGIGYPERDRIINGQAKVENCRYSIYKFDTKAQQIICICRKSTDKGNFVPDNTLYESSKEDGVYIIPWDKYKISDSNNEMALTQENELELDPVPIAAGWSGRKDEIDIISSQENNVVYISGVGGQGKTALASEFLRLQRKEKNSIFSKFIWVDCRELDDTMHLKIQQLLEVISDGNETVIKYKDEPINETISRFCKHIRNRNCLVVFDNVDAYVNLDTEELVGELNLLIDKVLNIEHKSKIIMTCRIPVYDSRANFRSIKLDGLKEPEGIDFFKLRGIKLETEEELEYCKKIISKTKGHPWWLGLVAGQIATDSSNNFKTYMQLHGDNLLSNKNKLQDFFEVIWNQLGNAKKGKTGQSILRHLIETTKPISVSNITSLVNENYNRVTRILNMLKKLSLLERHEDEQDELLYQVHPLVREYLHTKYTVEKQKNYVCSILKLYLEPQIIIALFDHNQILPITGNRAKSSKDIVDSIDTCINSRNYVEALKLLSEYYIILRDEGLFHDYISLGCRILKIIDWEKEQIVKVKRLSRFLADLIDILDTMGQVKNRDFFLKQYKNFSEQHTIPYSGYLTTLAIIEWRNEDFSSALQHVNDYEQMKDVELWNFHDIENTKALILRDTGKIDESMELFSKQPISSSVLGNIARCYQKKENYIEAINKLEESLELMNEENNLTNCINKGYAYLWLAEIYECLGKIDDEKKYIKLCREQWNEYAPGLLTKNLKLQFNK
jgi:predicted MPP superfamily phosphohydrolase/tetratricopeptide (TPR) repeat protein